MLNKNFILIVFLFLSALSCRQESVSSETPAATETTKEMRIVSLSGFLTETLFTLGYGDQIIGRDVTSTYPESATKLPSLGHLSQLNAEALLGMKPDIVFVEKKAAQQAEVLSQLKNAGIKVAEITTSLSFQNTVHAAAQIEQYLPEKSEVTTQLASKIQMDSTALASKLAAWTDSPKVLFIYARGARTLMVAGTGTSVETSIEKAGGQNAITSFADFKPLTPEALIEAKPDVLLMFTSGLASLEGKEGLSQIPAIAQTPAFKNDRIIAMDGHYLTAFGPRSVQAISELADKIHSDEK
ncbi:MAG: iron complex transport system substrate-binding protein [Saprospiraceae bacterium]|jgi:iron complex transport system substrate-binding protein